MPILSRRTGAALAASLGLLTMLERHTGKSLIPQRMRYPRFSFGARMIKEKQTMSSIMKLAVALALTVVTTTGALAASQKHKRTHAPAYNAYARAVDAAYGAPVIGSPLVAPQMHMRAYAPAYNPYASALDAAYGAPQPPYIWFSNPR